MTLDEQRAAYAASTTEFLSVARTVPEHRLDVAPEGEWSARQVIHHLADAEVEAASRLRRLLAEAPGSPLLAFDESAWADVAALGYRTDPVGPSLDLIEALRARNLDVLERLGDEDLARWAEHSTAGRYTVERWLATYTSHPSAHVAQIRAVLEG